MAECALIVVDMLQGYEHEDADVLREHVEDSLPAMCRTVKAANDAGAPVIYVNDTFDDWRSDRRTFLESLEQSPHFGLIEPILPTEDMMLVTKARHSIFFQTPLEYLLGQSDIESIVLIGQVTEQCILYSALDAHIRRIPTCIPRDAVAHIHEDLADASLRMMELNMDAEVCNADEVRF
jgi:nicotinamidase-related amidase